MMPVTRAADAKRRTPGEEGIWVLIIGDLLIFTLFFLTILYYRAMDPEVFVRSQPMLSTRLGLTNTVLLLLSSLLVALAVHRARTARRAPGWLFAGAFVCGVAFVGIKLVEYGEKLRSGIGFATNDFFMLYFAFTGIHLLHVLIGLGVLSWARTASQRSPLQPGTLVLIESGALFWHLVDLLWIVLFALFYLVR